MARKLGEQLLEQQVLTPELLAQALERQKESGRKLGECLVRLGLNETPVLRLLAQELKTRFVSTAKLAQAPIDPALLDRVPVRLAEGFDFMPLRLDEASGVLYGAMAEPQRQRAIEEIARAVGVTRVLPFVAVQRSIRAAIRKHYYADAQAFEHMNDDGACPHCGAPSAPSDFQCPRCELLLVRSPDDLPARDNVSIVRALLTLPESTGVRSKPPPPPQDKTRVSPYARSEPRPPAIPIITGSLDITRSPLHPFEAYILSFVDGRTSVDDLVNITGLADVELLAIFESLAERGITRLVPIRDGRVGPVARPGPSVPWEEPANPSAAGEADNILQRAVQLEHEDRINEAIELLMKGISQLTQPAPLYNRLGLILVNQWRDYARAAELFRRAAELDPDNSVHKMNLDAVLGLQAEAARSAK
jgi:type IV pilus assembly protein PilB